MSRPMSGLCSRPPPGKGREGNGGKPPKAASGWVGAQSPECSATDEKQHSYF